MVEEIVMNIEHDHDSAYIVEEIVMIMIVLNMVEEIVIIAIMTVFNMVREIVRIMANHDGGEANALQ